MDAKQKTRTAATIHVTHDILAFSKLIILVTNNPIKVIIPILVIIVEHRNINFSELIFLSLAKISIFINKPKMAKKFFENLGNLLSSQTFKMIKKKKKKR